jgi:hypothetical protein
MSDLLSHLSHVPTVTYPLAAGLVTTSSILFGNVGLSLVGPLPIIRGRLGTHNLDAKQRVRVWKLFFDGAAVSAVVPRLRDVNHELERTGYDLIRSLCSREQSHDHLGRISIRTLPHPMTDWPDPDLIVAMTMTSRIRSTHLLLLLTTAPVTRGCTN